MKSATPMKRKRRTQIVRVRERLANSVTLDARFVNVATRSIDLRAVKVMSSSTGPAEGFAGWVDGTFDCPAARGETVSAVTVVLWFYTKKRRKP